jgi:hypothetical protein
MIGGSEAEVAVKPVVAAAAFAPGRGSKVLGATPSPVGRSHGASAHGASPDPPRRTPGQPTPRLSTPGSAGNALGALHKGGGAMAGSNSDFRSREPSACLAAMSMLSTWRG